jgi:hypothetical protein
MIQQNFTFLNENNYKQLDFLYNFKFDNRIEELKKTLKFSIYWKGRFPEITNDFLKEIQYWANAFGVLHEHVIREFEDKQ